RAFSLILRFGLSVLALESDDVHGHLTPSIAKGPDHVECPGPLYFSSRQSQPSRMVAHWRPWTCRPFPVTSLARREGVGGYLGCQIMCALLAPRRPQSA